MYTILSRSLIVKGKKERIRWSNLWDWEWFFCVLFLFMEEA